MHIGFRINGTFLFFDKLINVCKKNFKTPL